MITSTQNPQIKNIAALLKQAKERRLQKMFVAEGPRMCGETPEERLEKLYFSESYVSEHDLSEWEHLPYEIVKDSVFAQASDTRNPQGVLALVRMDEKTEEELLHPTERPLFLLLENLQDPGNLGTILRTAEGAGVNGIFLSGDCVDIYSPKVIRSTMGALYRVPFAVTENFPYLLERLEAAEITRYAAILKESVVYTEPDYSAPCAFLIGNEGNGLTEETIAKADIAVRIPMRGQVESLNASVAASLLVYEARRQRGFY